MSINVGMLACYDQVSQRLTITPSCQSYILYIVFNRIHLTFLSFFQAKETLGAFVFMDEENKPPSTQTQLGASLIAGVTATACSLPFDMLKSRMRKSLIA